MAKIKKTSNSARLWTVARIAETYGIGKTAIQKIIESLHIIPAAIADDVEIYDAEGVGRIIRESGAATHGTNEDDATALRVNYQIGSEQIKADGQKIMSGICPLTDEVKTVNGKLAEYREVSAAALRSGDQSAFADAMTNTEQMAARRGEILSRLRTLCGPETESVIQRLGAIKKIGRRIQVMMTERRIAAQRDESSAVASVDSLEAFAAHELLPTIRETLRLLDRESRNEK